jgi:hypothetical protein
MNSRAARFSVGPSKCYVKKATEKLVSLSLRQLALGASLRRSAFGVSQSSSLSRRNETSVQCSSDSRIQEATSAIVLIVIVTMCRCNLHSE